MTNANETDKKHVSPSLAMHPTKSVTKHVSRNEGKHVNVNLSWKASDHLHTLSVQKLILDTTPRFRNKSRHMEENRPNQ